MTATTVQPTGATRTGSPRSSGWQRLLLISALVHVFAGLTLMAVGRFFGPSIVASEVVILAGCWRLARPGRAGILLTAVPILATFLLHLGWFRLYLSAPEIGPAFVVTAASVLASLLAIATAVPAWIERTPQRSPVPRTLFLTAAAALALTVVISAVMWIGRDQHHAQPGDLAIANDGRRVSTQRLSTRAGQVTILVRNTDPLSPRSFDIKQLGVHQMIPPATARRVRFTAPVGTYPFRDDITFTADTSGVLIVF
jgi:hypothetical protein